HFLIFLLSVHDQNLSKYEAQRLSFSFSTFQPVCVKTLREQLDHQLHDAVELVLQSHPNKIMAIFYAKTQDFHLSTQIDVLMPQDERLPHQWKNSKLYFYSNEKVNQGMSQLPL